MRKGLQSMHFDMSALEWPVLPVIGSADRFPVGRIFCVGRNYRGQTGEASKREAPIFFTKFATALLPEGGLMPFPPGTAMVHHEVELVLAVGSAAFQATPDTALDHLYGYAVGLDMTRRDLLAEAQSAGRPWDMAKNFACSAPVGAISPVSQCGHLDSGHISLILNGESRQAARLEDMIWSPAEIIAELSKLESLQPGDLIFTGTPAGVGPIQIGDVLEARIDGLEPLLVQIGPAR